MLKTPLRIILSLTLALGIILSTLAIARKSVKAQTTCTPVLMSSDGQTITYLSLCDNGTIRAYILTFTENDDGTISVSGRIIEIPLIIDIVA